MRKFVWRSLLIAGLALIVLSVVPIFFEERITLALRDAINSRINAEVSFNEAHISLWKDFPRLTVSIDGLSLAGKHEFHGDTLVRANRVDFSLGTSEFLSGEGIHVQHLGLHNAEIHISILSNGMTNLDVAQETSPTDTASAVVLDIESWEISDGQLRYEDRSSGFLWKSESLNAKGILALEGEILTFGIDGATNHTNAEWSGKKYLREKMLQVGLKGTYDFDKDVLSFSENFIRVNDLGLAFSGGFDFSRADTTGVQLKLKTEEARFADILSLSHALFEDFERFNISGRLGIEAEVLGDISIGRELYPAFKAQLAISDGAIGYHHLPSSVNAINCQLIAFNPDGNLSNTTIELLYLGMNIGDNPVFGSASIQGLKNGSVSGELIANFPLEEISSVYPVDSIDVSGELNVALKIDGPFSGSLSNLLHPSAWNTTRIPPFLLNLELTDGTLAYEGLRTRMSAIHLLASAENTTGLLRDTKVKVDSVQAVLGNNRLAGMMKIEGLGDPRIEGEIQTSMDLADLDDFVSLSGVEVAGRLGLALKVDGIWSAEKKMFPKVSGDLRVDHASIRSPRYPVPLEDAHLELHAINETGHFEDTRLVIDTFTYSIDDEPFAIKGSVVNLDNPHYDLTMNGVLYLDKIQKILTLDDVGLRGRVDVAFDAKGNLEDLRLRKYHRLPTEGEIRLQDVFVSNTWLDHELRIESGHLFFSNEKVFLDTLHGELGESHFSLSGHFQNYLAFLLHREEQVKGDLLFESENFDLNELLRERKDYHDTVHHDMSVVRFPKNIDLTFDARLSKLRYKNLTLENADGEVVLRDGVLTLNKTTFDCLGAAFALSGDFDPRKPTHPLFDFEIGVHELDISKAHEAFLTVQAIAPAAEHTYGIFSLDYKMKGELTSHMLPVFKSIQGKGTVRVRDAKVNGMKLLHHVSGLTKKESLANPEVKDIVMDIAVNDGTINVEPFTMKLGGFDTEITGKHEITGAMNYVIRIALPPFDLVKIPLHIDGTYDNPKVHVGKGHEESLRKALGMVSENGVAGYKGGTGNFAQQ